MVFVPRFPDSGILGLPTCKHRVSNRIRRTDWGFLRGHTGTFCGTFGRGFTCDYFGIRVRSRCSSSLKVALPILNRDLVTNCEF